MPRTKATPKAGENSALPTGASAESDRPPAPRNPKPSPTNPDERPQKSSDRPQVTPLDEDKHIEDGIEVNET
jgi:hypothetical protein